LAGRLDDMMFNADWSNASITARRIADITDYMAKLQYRLEDVKGINAQFARIQEHIDRLDAQLKEAQLKD
jgi:outer membrane receptor for Fe3+-dicitrate